MKAIALALAVLGLLAVASAAFDEGSCAAATNRFFITHNEYYRWFHDQFRTNAQDAPCSDDIANAAGALSNASDFWVAGSWQDAVTAVGDAAYALSNAFPESSCNLNVGARLVDNFRKTAKSVFDNCHGLSLGQARAVVSNLDEGWLVAGENGDLAPLDECDAAAGLWLLLHSASWANNNLVISKHTPITIPFAHKPKLAFNKVRILQDDGDLEIPDIPEVPEEDIPEVPEDLPTTDPETGIDDGQDAVDDASDAVEDNIDSVTEDGQEAVDDNQDDAEDVYDENKDDAEEIYDDNKGSAEDARASANNEWALLRDLINSGTLDPNDPNFVRAVLSLLGLTV